MTILSGQRLTPARLNADNVARRGCRLRRSSQSVATGATTAITNWTEDQDTDGFYPGSGTTVTIPTGLDGLYVSTYYVNTVGAGVGARYFGSINVTSAVTGTPTIFRNQFDFTEDRTFVSLAGVPLLAGDTLTCDVFHSQGGNLNVDAWWTLYRIGV